MRCFDLLRSGAACLTVPIYGAYSEISSLWCHQVSHLGHAGIAWIPVASESRPSLFKVDRFTRMSVLEGVNGPLEDHRSHLKPLVETKFGFEEHASLLESMPS